MNFMFCLSYYVDTPLALFQLVFTLCDVALVDFLCEGTSNYSSSLYVCKNLDLTQICVLPQVLTL